MRRFTSNESGYALLLSFCVVLIFSILGLSLMTLTASGVSKNSNREDIILAQDLSDKGVDFVVGDIQKYLEKEIVDNPMGKTEFGDFLNETLNATALKCPVEGQPIPVNIGISIPAENNNTTKICIDEVKNIETISGIIEEKDKYKRIVTFKSIGMVDGREHISKTDVIIGTDAVPDQLRYAVSTNDEGNLYLHGGVEIQGDIKTDGHLILSDRATWFSGTTPQWQPSVYATVLKDTKSVTPKLIMREYIPGSTKNKNVYTLKKGQTPGYNNHISGNSFNSNNYTVYSTSLNNSSSISSSFFNSEKLKIVTRSLPIDTIAVSSKVLEFSDGNTDYSYKNNLNVTGTQHNTGKLNKTNTVFISDTKTVKVDEIIIVQEKYCIEKSKRWPYRCIKEGTRDVNKTTKKDTFVNQKGKFTINGGNQEINLKGTYYIYGDLKIENVKLNTDALIYVDGKVEISNSTINGVEYTNRNPDGTSTKDEGTLIIFSTGTIDIYNISVDSEISKPSKIKGYFYSQDDLIMYGVGSNINLYGGISAKRVILTAVRGKSEKGYNTADEQKELEDGKPKLGSRLKIIYDENLISQYTTFKRDQEEEFITQLNDPETIKRY